MFIAKSLRKDKPRQTKKVQKDAFLSQTIDDIERKMLNLPDLVNVPEFFVVFP